MAYISTDNRLLIVLDEHICTVGLQAGNCIIITEAFSRLGVATERVQFILQPSNPKRTEAISNFTLDLQAGGFLL